MAKFRNQSGLRQVLRLPSVHFKKTENGIFWDDTPARKILEPDEILETSVETDVEYLRGLAADQLVHVQGERRKVPGVLIEVR